MNETDERANDGTTAGPLQYTAETVPPSGRAVQAALPLSSPDTLRMRALSILAIALIACAAVFHGWRKGYVLAPTDALQLVAPWATPGNDYVARNEQLLDQTVQFVPWTIYTLERYRQGQIPLWNPYSQLGAPFMANGQSAIFYPTILLHLNLPETWSWTISAALRLFLAGLGMYLLAGRYGLRRFPRLLTAVAFMLCGFNVVWLNHPQTNVMPLLPWAVLMTEMLIQRVTLHRVLGATLVFFIQFLGGHPASCIHLLLTCALVWVLRIIIPQKGNRSWSQPLRSGGALSAAVAFAFALAAAQWLPLLEYAQHSGAAIVRQDKLHHESMIATDPRYLLGLLFPYANGFPDGVAPFEFRRVTHLPNTNELAPGFIGTIPLVLALFAAITLRRQRIVKLWTILALIAAAIAIKFPGVDHLVRLIPGLNVAQNARMLAITALALSILAGFGLDALTLQLREGIDPVRTRKILARIACTLAGIAILAAIVLLAAKNPILNRGYAKAETEYNANPVHEHSLDHVKSVVRRVHLELLLTTARLLIPAAMLGLAAFLLWRHQRRQGRSIACCAWPWFGLALIDLLAFAIPFNPGAPAETYFPGKPAIHKLRDLPPYRIAATFRTLPPETATAFSLADIRGYDALAPERYYRWWAHPGIGELPPSAQGYLARLENPEHPAWSLLNFGYLLTAPEQPAPGEPFKAIDTGEDATIYQAVAPRPRAWVATRAEVSETAQAVLDRIANMDKSPFNPDDLVLLDKQVPDDPLITSKFWEALRPGSSARKPTVDFLPPPTKNDEDRPEIVRLRVSGASGGYLVLADTYFPGWTATITEANGPARDVPILPAYGTLRAVALPAGSSTLRVDFQYKPLSWRIGVMISLASLCLLALLIGFTLFRQTFSFERSPMPIRALILLACLILPQTGCSADNPVAPQKDADGFTSLFNGKDLNGWVPVNVAAGTDHDTFTVQDGLIVCTGVPTGVMRTEKMYENFIVELEWRHLRPGGNSGFFVWSDALTSKGVPFTRAVENQILDGPGGDGYTTQGDVFAIHGASLTPGNPGKWKGRSYPTESRTKPSPEWNHYRIECNNGAIALAVNGKVVTTGKDVSQRKGYLCLESEGGLINFRNLRIKELPPTENLDPKFIAQKDEGYKSLYTGLDLTNWDASPIAGATWKPKDWILHFDPIPTGKAADFTLWTQAKFKNLDLILDLRTADPVTIRFRGVDLRIDPPVAAAAKPTWRRLHFRANDNTLTATLDDKPQPQTPNLPTNPAESPLGLSPTGPTDFANIYLKPLP